MQADLDLEPSERNPAAIRRTVIFLVVMMIVGGTVLIQRYLAKQGEEYKETAKGRPAMSLGVLTRHNFQVEGPKGKVYHEGFTFMEGKVSLMTTISVETPEESKVVLATMRDMQQRFAGEQRMQFVCVSGDPYEKLSADQLKAFCVEHGGGEDWLYLTSKGEEFSKYIKNTLKLGSIVSVHPDTGKKIYPDILRLVDPSMRLRGQQDHFYFYHYSALQEQARRDVAAGKQLSKQEEGRVELVKIWKDYLEKNIRYILKDEEYDVEKIRQENRSNRYEKALWVAGGLLLFVLVIGYRVSKAAKARS